MANITEIAKALGVAPSTVSRALKRPDLVSLKTRQDVLKKAEELGYLKKLRQDASNTGTGKLIGLMVADLSNIFSAHIVKAVSDFFSEQRGCSVVIGCSYEQPACEQRLLKSWSGLNLEGLIVMPTPKFEQSVSSLGGLLPLVLVDRPTGRGDKYNCVTEDNRDGAGQGMEHLLELGHQRIAFISGSRKVYTFDERCKGAAQACPEAEIIEIQADSYDNLFSGAFDETNILMMRRKASRPTAIFCANNALTAGALYALSLKNISIPGDISVIAYGDSDWCRFYPTPITSLRQPVEAMGTMAAQLLLERMDSPGAVPQITALKSMLMKRASAARIS